MTVLTVVFIVVYLAVLGMYFFSETSGNFKRRVINKSVLASLFLAYGLIVYLLMFPVGTIHTLCILAVAFSWAGDILLLYSFFKGGIPFSIGNLLFIAYEIVYMVKLGVPFQKVWWCIPLFFVLWGALHVLSEKGWLAGKHITGFNRYALTTTAHGCIGIAFAAAYPTLPVILLGVGLFLFMISDYFLALHNFKNHESKLILRLNSGTYFVGLMLVVLSLTAVATSIA